jgi:hypothetical protein
VHASTRWAAALEHQVQIPTLGTHCTRARSAAGMLSSSFIFSVSSAHQSTQTRPSRALEVKNYTPHLLAEAQTRPSRTVSFSTRAQRAGHQAAGVQAGSGAGEQRRRPASAAVSRGAVEQPRPRRRRTSEASTASIVECARVELEVCSRFLSPPLVDSRLLF